MDGQRVAYSSHELKQLSSYTKIKRKVRKNIFNLSLWKPASPIKEITVRTTERHGVVPRVNNNIKRHLAPLTGVCEVSPCEVKGKLLSLCCLNARSVNNKSLSVAELLKDNNYDILALTETWAGTNTDQQAWGEIVLPGYEYHQIPRQTGRRGGGVAVVYRSSLSLSIVRSTVNEEFNQFEYLDCMINIDKHPAVRLCVVYRPPPSIHNELKTNSFLEEWAAYLDQLSVSPHHVIITGDFNFHMEDSSNADTIKFTSLLDSHGLTQHIKEPTHVKGHTLDLVITRDTDGSLLQPPKVFDPCLFDQNGVPTRDHFAVSFCMHVPKPPNPRKVVNYRELRKINVQDFVRDIASCSEIQNVDKSLDELVEAYNKNLTTIVDKHAPLCTRTITLRPHSPWYTEELRTAKHERRRRERKWHQTKLKVHYDLFQEQSKAVAKLVRTTKQSYFIDQIAQCNGDQKQLFKITKKLLGESGKVTLPNHTSPHELAQQFSSFFSSKISTIREHIPLSVSSVESEQAFTGTPLMEFESATVEEVRKVVSGAPTKSCEIDPIPTWLLKQCDELTPIITAIINKSMSTSQVPSNFKQAVIRPLLKKPDLDPDVLKNYRPVSNLPFISKVLERIVSNRIDQHLNEYNLLDEYQSAYRKNYSTETALLRVQTDILKALDSGFSVALIMLDLSAAFDTLDHNILLKRFEHSLGIAGNAIRWLGSYLSGRTQRVVIDSAASDDVLLQFGVPQGSVFGPKGYSMYTGPLGNIFRKYNMSHMLYADDSQSYTIVKANDSLSQSASNIQSCLSEVKEWMNANMLKLNCDKTEFIIFSPRHSNNPAQNLHIELDHATLSPAPFVKNLGVIQDCNLTMEKHVNNLSRSCYYQIRNIGKIRKCLTTDACRTLVQANVTSRLDYANSLLYGLPDTLLCKLQRVQNAAARLITRTQRRDHITPVLMELHWLPVEQRLAYKILLYTFKATKGDAPSYIGDLLEVHQPTRNLRSNARSLLVVPKTRTVTYGDRSFSSAAANLWNDIPESMKNANSIDIFKRQLKTRLFTQAFKDYL